MKSINSVVIVFGLLLVVGLTYSSVSLQPVFANLPDPCFGKHSPGCANMVCNNNPLLGTAHCCWTELYTDKTVCQTCDVNKLERSASLTCGSAALVEQ